MSRYTSEVDSISLKESESKEDIRSLKSTNYAYENLTNNLKSMLPNQQAISSNQQIIQTLGQQKHELQEEATQIA